MFTRTFSGSLLILSLTGCGREPAAEAPALPLGERVACATSDGAPMRECYMEQAGDDVVVRHADGGFRRLRITANGSGFAAADGAVVATSLPRGRLIDVSIAGERYLLPAKTIGNERR